LLIDPILTLIVDLAYTLVLS